VENLSSPDPKIQSNDPTFQATYKPPTQKIFGSFILRTWYPKDMGIIYLTPAPLFGVAVWTGLESSRGTGNMDNIDEPIILDCDECGTNTVFGPDGLKSDERITCPACHMDYGSVAEILTLKKAAAETAQFRFGKTFEGVEDIKFTKDDI
jgi:hypothetical protein